MSQNNSDADNELLESLREDFLAEARLELEAWEENLLDYDSSGDNDRLIDFKRQVHSMKGSSAAIGLIDLNGALHGLEDWLAASEGKIPARQIATTGLSFVDGLRAYCSAVASKNKDAAERAVASLCGLVS